MNPIAATLILLGTSLSVVAALGLLRLPTAYARVHAAGKASPISFLLVAAGCGVELGFGAAAQLGVAAVALVTTLPVASHLLFRAIYRTTPSDHLHADALGTVEVNGEFSPAEDSDDDNDAELETS